MMENKKCLKPSTSHCSIHFKTAKLPSQLYFEMKWNGELQRACIWKKKGLVFRKRMEWRGPAGLYFEIEMTCISIKRGLVFRNRVEWRAPVGLYFENREDLYFDKERTCISK